MGSATVQGQLWGARAQDWAAYTEQVSLPLFAAVLGDLEALPFADSTFDAVTAVNSLFYAADMDTAMRELVRVCGLAGGSW
jgi:ubiquinone/menaquinone biosynthesis C-methylase UbiE